MTYPPPLPPPPPLLPRNPSQVGQVIGGAAITLAAATGISCFSTVFPGSVTDNIFVMIGFICVVSLVAGLMVAQQLRRRAHLRGWAHGIYLGLGVTLAFFAVVTLFLAILVIKSPHG
jgi:general stress protein CsbA